MRIALPSRHSIWVVAALCFHIDLGTRAQLLQFHAVRNSSGGRHNRILPSPKAIHTPKLGATFLQVLRPPPWARYLRTIRGERLALAAARMIHKQEKARIKGNLPQCLSPAPQARTSPWGKTSPRITFTDAGPGRKTARRCSIGRNVA
jgi:hypothetical protein